MNERDCTNCKHHTSDGCSSWDCEFEAKDLISRADAIKAVASITMPIHLSDVICDKLLALPSADAPKGDLISRQWLLEVYGDYIGDNGEPKYHVPLEVVRQNIKDAPSAEAEWIPCSDRLPSEDGRYLVTYPLFVLKNKWVDALWYGKPCMPNRKVKGKCWYRADNEWGDVVYDDSEILAWMPLPKPYREDGE